MAPIKNPSSAKKKTTTTKGRQKIEIKRIEDPSRRQVTFTKRRGGLFRKAAELCIVSGAEIAIVAHSRAHVFTCGHPTAESVIDRFLGDGGSSGVDHASSSVANLLHDYNRREIELEKMRKEAIEISRGGGGGDQGMCWWDEEVDGMGLDELEMYSEAMDELVQNLTKRADELQSSTTTIIDELSSTTLTTTSTDELGSFVNHNQRGADSLFYGLVC